MSSSMEPSAGEIANGVHRLPVRVYLEDTDAGGVVYHAGYLRFMERARTDYLRVTGFSHSAFMSSQNAETLLVVRHMDIDFLLPALLDDALVVTTRVTQVRGASLVMQQEVLRGSECLLRAAVKVGVIGADKRPARMPQELRQRLLQEVVDKED